jgi:carboxylesterase
MRRLLLGLAAVLLIGLVWLLWPTSAPRVRSAAPARSYAAAVARLDALRARDPAALVPGCGTRALLHGRPTPRAVVLLHGITNCPLQFRVIADSLAARGDNVLVPRVDHHGLPDRMGPELQRLRAEDMARLVSECVAIAGGLGDTVVVAGLSTSGVAAAWAAAHLRGVDRAVMIAPAFAPAMTANAPAWVPAAVTRAAVRLPNVFVWWDDRARRELQGPAQCYYGFSTRALAQAYRMGEHVRARRSPVMAREVVLLVTEADVAVDNRIGEHLVADWGRQTPAPRVREVHFPAAARVLHDMVDPDQVGARVDVAYPVMLALLRGEGLPPGSLARETAAGRDAAVAGF